MNTSENHTLMCEMSGFLPKKDSKGVAVSEQLLAVRLMAWTTDAKASAQRKSGALASFITVHPLSKILWFALLATPFCSRVWGTVNSRLIPCSSQYLSKVEFTYSPPQSDLRILVCDW